MRAAPCLPPWAAGVAAALLVLWLAPRRARRMHLVADALGGEALVLDARVAGRARGQRFVVQREQACGAIGHHQRTRGHRARAVVQVHEAGLHHARELAVGVLVGQRDQALLEADVSLTVVRKFTQMSSMAVGQWYLMKPKTECMRKKR